MCFLPAHWWRYAPCPWRSGPSETTDATAAAVSLGGQNPRVGRSCTPHPVLSSVLWVHFKSTGWSAAGNWASRKSLPGIRGDYYVRGHPQEATQACLAGVTRFDASVPAKDPENAPVELSKDAYSGHGCTWTRGITTLQESKEVCLPSAPSFSASSHPKPSTLPNPRDRAGDDIFRKRGHPSFAALAQPGWCVGGLSRRQAGSLCSGIPRHTSAGELHARTTAILDTPHKGPSCCLFILSARRAWCNCSLPYLPTYLGA